MKVSLTITFLLVLGMLLGGLFYISQANICTSVRAFTCPSSS